MADYIAQGNKTIYCEHGHPNVVPLQTTVHKCSTCDCYIIVWYYGAIIDKNGNYVY